nr:hypothetical protein [Tanacetum cinerariifolium]
MIRLEMEQETTKVVVIKEAKDRQEGVRAPNYCSSSIGKTRGLLSFSRGIASFGIRAMVQMVERNRGENLIRRFAGRGNKPDPRDMNIANLKQQIQELEFSQLQQDSPTKEAETESNETKSEPIIWYIEDEEEEYLFVNKYPSFQEEHIVLVEEKLCPIYDTDNEEEESMPVYDIDIEDVIEKKKDLLGKKDLVEKKTT